MAIPISHEECWNRLQRLGVEHQAMKYELDDSAAELDRLRSVNAELLEALRWAVGCDYARGGTIGQVYIVRQAIAKAEGKTE